MTEPVLIDERKRLSESLLWKFQRDYFANQGVHAWSQQVPFYVTSNPYIANCYAQLVINFMRDYITANPEAKEHTFYIFELGTGSGCFSFHALKRIVDLRLELGLEDIKFCYVMTDFTESNLEFWRKQEALSAFVDQGVLDFAIFNMEEDQEMFLTERKITLTPENVINPTMVYANYIFDTVSHDCFYIHNGKLEEALVSLKAPAEDYADGILNNFDNLSVEYSNQKAADQYYTDKNFNAVLYRFKKSLTNTYMLFPIAGLRTIRNLMKLNKKMVLISSDKAYSGMEQLDHLGKPGISFHGSFSLMVNYRAISEYFQRVGGEAVLQIPRKGIDSIVGMSGVDLKDLPNFRYAVRHYIEEMSPSHYFLLHRRVSENFEDYDVATLASHLCFTHWDPHIFKKLVKKICEDIENTDAVTVNYLAENMVQISNNFYFMPGAYDVMFDIGVFFQYIKDHDKALHYFKKSEYYFGEQFGLLYNMALSYYHLDRYQDALESFKKALSYDPEAENAKEWIEHIEKEHPSLAAV